MKYLFHYIFFLVLASSFQAKAISFTTPLSGIAYQDWTIVNYVDRDPSQGSILDPINGNYTYDGHNAIDFTVANFAQMDAGIDIFAAESGTVINVVDGFYDRCSRINPCPANEANFITIDHGNGIVTEYVHLKNSSPVVNVGDIVLKGQKIAEMGSSGASTDAHLHFTVIENGIIVPTYLNPTQWWDDPLPYAGNQLGTLDHGIIGSHPTLADLVNRPTDVNEFVLGNLIQPHLWINLFGTDFNDLLTFSYYRPDNSLFNAFDFTPGEIHYGWWWVFATLPEQALTGEWKIVADVNGQVIAADTFNVVANQSNVPMPSAVYLIFLGLGLLLVRKYRTTTSIAS